MRLLITGTCGFVGSSLCEAIRQAGLPWDLVGFDNLSRAGSERNRPRLRHLGVDLRHGDLRCQSDVDALPPVDWIIDAAANPSVLAGADGRTSSRQLMEHNLWGTVNLLEKCRADRAGFILLSTSRVYAIEPLAALPVTVQNGAFAPDLTQALPSGVTGQGISESFSTAAPVSLYGASKLASEALALEYGATFDFPVWINRCGVMAGAGQFGRADQGIFAYWINAHLRKKPLRYIGFDGLGHQIRDCLHPRDLVPLLQAQCSRQPAAGSRETEDGIPGDGMSGDGGLKTDIADPHPPIRNPQSSIRNRQSILNVSGGAASALSLRQLTAWCDDRFGPHPVSTDPHPRPFDLPWVVLDSTLASETWHWQPTTPVHDILEEIARHAEKHPEWLEVSSQ